MAFALTTADQLTRGIEEIIGDVCPAAVGRSMYGGTVFETEPGDPKTMVCGHFVYKNHVSLEFGNGYQLSDPDGVLEGKGKYRRHIKLFDASDIDEKSVRAMLQQAFS